MAAVTVHLARSAVVDVLTLILAAASAVLLLRYRVSATWLLVGGAGVGLASALVAAWNP
jgi:chromate transporter